MPIYELTPAQQAEVDKLRQTDPAGAEELHTQYLMAPYLERRAAERAAAAKPTQPVAPPVAATPPKPPPVVPVVDATRGVVLGPHVDEAERAARSSLARQMVLAGADAEAAAQRAGERVARATEPRTAQGGRAITDVAPAGPAPTGLRAVVAALKPQVLVTPEQQAARDKTIAELEDYRRRLLEAKPEVMVDTATYLAAATRPLWDRLSEDPATRAEVFKTLAPEVLQSEATRAAVAGDLPPAKPYDLQGMAAKVLTERDPRSGAIVEAPIATVLRDLGALWRPLFNPLIEAYTYDVDAQGNVIDKNDRTLALIEAGKAARDTAADVIGGRSLVANLPGAGAVADFLGKRVAPIMPQARKTAPPVGGEQPVGTVAPFTGRYLDDLAFTIARGQALGDDLMALEDYSAAYADIGLPNAPWWIGLGAEVALPATPVGLAGKAADVAGVVRVVDVARSAPARKVANEMLAALPAGEKVAAKIPRWSDAPTVKDTVSRLVAEEVVPVVQLEKLVTANPAAVGASPVLARALSGPISPVQLAVFREEVAGSAGGLKVLDALPKGATLNDLGDALRVHMAALETSGNPLVRRAVAAARAPLTGEGTSGAFRSTRDAVRDALESIVPTAADYVQVTPRTIVTKARWAEIGPAVAKKVRPLAAGTFETGQGGKLFFRPADPAAYEKAAREVGPVGGQVFSGPPLAESWARRGKPIPADLYHQVLDGGLDLYAREAGGIPAVRGAGAWTEAAKSGGLLARRVAAAFDKLPPAAAPLPPTTAFRAVTTRAAQALSQVDERAAALIAAEVGKRGPAEGFKRALAKSAHTDDGWTEQDALARVVRRMYAGDVTDAQVQTAVGDAFRSGKAAREGLTPAAVSAVLADLEAKYPYLRKLGVRTGALRRGEPEVALLLAAEVRANLARATLRDALDAPEARAVLGGPPAGRNAIAFTDPTKTPGAWRRLLTDVLVDPRDHAGVSEAVHRYVDEVFRPVEFEARGTLPGDESSTSTEAMKRLADAKGAAFEYNRKASAKMRADLTDETYQAVRDTLGATGVDLSAVNRATFERLLDSSDLGALAANPAEREILLQLKQQADTGQLAQTFARLRTTGNTTTADLALSLITGVWAGINRTTYTGMLGGWLLPNLRFHGGNFVTAPLIIATTTNAARAGAAIAEAARTAVRKAGKAPSVAAGEKVGEAFTDPLGRVWTWQAVEAAAKRNNLNTSMLSSEFGEAWHADVLRRAKLTRSGEEAETWRQIARNYLLPWRKTVFNRWAEETDNFWRKNVFVSALREGVPEPEAARLAQKSLLDYGSISEAERATVARYVMFYAFQRTMIAAVLEALATGKVNTIRRTALLANANLRKERKRLDLSGDMRLRLGTMLGETPSGGLQFAYSGPLAPNLDALNDIVNVLAWTYNGFDLTMFKRGVERDVSLNPTIEFINELRAGRTDGKDGGIVPASRVLALKAAGLWPWFVQAFDVNEVRGDQRSPTQPTFDGGAQYRIGSEGAYNRYLLAEQAAVRLGLKRLVDDYGNLAVAAGAGGAEPGPKKAAGVPEGVGRVFNLSTPTPLMDRGREHQQELRRVLAELRELSKDTPAPTDETAPGKAAQ